MAKDKKDRRIDELEKEIEHLKALAYKDELTGLYNRHGFKETAGKFIAEIEREKSFKGQLRDSLFIKDFGLLVFDIDDFKKLNDKYGHDAGDKALKIFSEIVLENIRDIDSAARWGGEEIVVGLVGANENDAYEVANRIRDGLSKTSFKYKGEKVKFTTSGGVASFAEAKTFSQILSLADKALYKAKSQGKNQIIKSSDL